jgi:hypothetical protein
LAVSLAIGRRKNRKEVRWRQGGQKEAAVVVQVEMTVA